jgi:hypothetical protein
VLACLPSRKTEEFSRKWSYNTYAKNPWRPSDTWDCPSSDTIGVYLIHTPVFFIQHEFCIWASDNGEVMRTTPVAELENIVLAVSSPQQPGIPQPRRFLCRLYQGTRVVVVGHVSWRKVPSTPVCCWALPPRNHTSGYWYPSRHPDTASIRPAVSNLAFRLALRA